MLIGLEKRFVFVGQDFGEPPGLRQALRDDAEVCVADDPEAGSRTMAWALDRFPDYFGPRGEHADRFFRFGVMQEPMERLGSLYRAFANETSQATASGTTSFEAFWTDRAANRKDRHDGRGLQRDLFCDTQGGLLVDVIIPEHGVAAILPEILAALDIGGTSTVHAAPRPPTFSPQKGLSDAVRAFLAPDYALWSTLDSVNARGMEKLLSLRR